MFKSDLHVSKRRRCRVAHILFAALSPVLPCSCQTLDSTAFINVVKSVSSLSDDPVVLLRPGQLLNPVYDHSDLDDSYASAQRLNAMLRPSIIYTPTAKDLGEAYAAILSSEQWARLALVPTQVEELKRARSSLYMNDGTTLTTGYARYVDKRKAYDELKKQYDNTRADKRTRDMDSELQTAADAVALVGQAIYESAEENYRLLTGAGSLKWKDSAIDALRQATARSAEGRTFLPADPSPQLDTLEDLDWVPISLKVPDLDSPGPLPRFAAALSQTRPEWWSWSEDPGPSAETCRAHIGDGEFTLTFDAAVARIGRGWLDPRVFDSQDWRWNSGSNAEVLSDGEDDSNSGSAPLYVSSVFIARSVTITGQGILPCLSFIRKAVANHQTVGFGPFTIAGVTSSPLVYYLPPIVTETGVHVIYPQVFGYGASVLPKAPNPNPAFVWPSKP